MPPSKSSEYTSAEETQALVDASQQVRDKRLEASDMVSTDEAAKLASTSSDQIIEWIGEGRCIGLAQTGPGFKVPNWQFEPSLLWPLVSSLSSALGTNDGWALLAFLETPHGALQGARPRSAIEQGYAPRVLDVAHYSDN